MIRLLPLVLTVVMPATSAAQDRTADGLFGGFFANWNAQPTCDSLTQDRADGRRLTVAEARALFDCLRDGPGTDLSRLSEGHRIPVYTTSRPFIPPSGGIIDFDLPDAELPG